MKYQYHIHLLKVSSIFPFLRFCIADIYFAKRHTYKIGRRYFTRKWYINMRIDCSQVVWLIRFLLNCFVWQFSFLFAFFSFRNEANEFLIFDFVFYMFREWHGKWKICGKKFVLRNDCWLFFFRYFTSLYKEFSIFEFIVWVYCVLQIAGKLNFMLLKRKLLSITLLVDLWFHLNENFKGNLLSLAGIKFFKLCRFNSVKCLGINLISSEFKWTTK